MVDIIVTDNTNNIKSSYKLRFNIKKLHSFLKRFNYLNSNDLFIFINETDKYIQVSYISNTNYNKYDIKITISNLTNNTLNIARNIIKDIFY